MNSRLVKYIHLLERVQRIATKLVPSLGNLCHKQRLITLYLPTSAYSKEWGEMILVFKITKKGIVNSNYEKLYKLNTTQTRGNELKLFNQKNRLNVRRKLFSQWMVELWNKLKDDIVNCTKVLQFEKLYDCLCYERRYNF